MGRALELSKEAVETYPPMPQLWLNRLTLLIDTGQLNGAREIMTRLSSLDLTQKEKGRLSIFMVLLDQKHKNIINRSNDKNG